ncbi:MAG: hypothetical protein JWM14_1535 [Chitinophagaceae bacterium]|nr:hypothetical protein [Chitinophagaceae bacterium]
MIFTRHTKALILILFIVCFHYPVFAQEEGGGIDVFLHPKKFYKKFFPHLKVKKPDIDSTYIKTYPDYLTVGSHLILPDIYLDLTSKSAINGSSGATSNWRTNIGNIIAFSASYRFITAGFAMVLSSNRKNNQDYAQSSYRTATIKYNGEAFCFQFKYIRTRGFTDVNESNSDSLSRYTKREDLLVKEYQFEGLYNFSWKKYSYYAPIDYTHRQLKTRFGFLVKAGAYYNELSADTNLLTAKQRSFFEDFNDIRKIRTTSFKLSPGAGLNLVFFKRFYAAIAVFTPYNLYVYNYFTKDDNLVHKGASIAFVLDANVSLGYQSERLYAGLRYQFDSKHVAFNEVEMASLFSYFGIDVGYRFKAPKVVRKIYKATMPPGM